MGCFKAPQHAFNPLELDILARAFDAAWDTIKAHQVIDDPIKDEELRTTLSERLMAIASFHEITDAETLRSDHAGSRLKGPSRRNGT